MTSGASVTSVSDTNMFTLDDTIRVVGVKGVTDPNTGRRLIRVLIFLILCCVYAVRMLQ